MSGTADLIALGFGSWSTIAKVPTLGFSIGTPIVIPGAEYAICYDRSHFETTNERVQFMLGHNRSQYEAGEE